MGDPHSHITSMDSNDSVNSNKDHHFNQGHNFQNLHYPTYGFPAYSVQPNHQNFVSTNHYTNNFSHPFQPAPQRDQAMNVAFDLSNRGEFVQQAQQSIGPFFPVSRHQTATFDLSMKQNFIYSEKQQANVMNQQQQQQQQHRESQNFSSLLAPVVDTSAFEMSMSQSQQMEQQVKVQNKLMSDMSVKSSMPSQMMQNSLLPGDNFNYMSKPSPPKPPKKKKILFPEFKPPEMPIEDSIPLKKQNVLANLKLAVTAAANAMLPSVADPGPKGGKSKDVFPCPHCDKSYSHKPSLRKHVAAVHDEMRYPCPTCGLVFTQRTGVRRHVNAVHLKEVSFTCDICAKNFFRKALLKLHQRVHSGEKPYLCQECGKSFPKNSSFKRHMRFHNGTKAYACKLCGRTFNEKYNLKAHLHRAHKTELDDATGVSLMPDKPLMKNNEHRTVDFHKLCSEPGTSSIGDLLPDVQHNGFAYGNHENPVFIGNQEDPQILDDSAEDSRKESINTPVGHESELEKREPRTDPSSDESVNSDHEELATAFYGTCTDSSGGTGLKVTIKKEVSRDFKELEVKKENEDDEDAPLSTRSTQKKKSVRKRDPNCPNEYACRECGKKYLNPSSVYVHMAAAHRQRRFTCTECPKDFVHKQHLVRHLEAVHNIETKRANNQISHKCDVCQEEFSNKKNLRKHEQSHVQGFKCGYCKVMFPTRDAMLQHIPTHMNDWIHQCTICGERFEKVAHLNRHLPSHLNV